MEKQRLVAPLRQCSSTPVGFGKEFIAKKNVPTLNIAHTSDLALADFYLFPRMKSALKGRCFCDATDTIKNAMKELKRLSQNSSIDVSNEGNVA
jgi:hypothetical protein